MFVQLEGHITDEEIELVLGIIKSQYQKYLRLTGKREFNDVFSAEYAPHKKQHSISWAISSGFQRGQRFGSLLVSRLKYGRGHVRPVLSNDRIELMILDKTTDFQASYLKERYLYNRDGFAEQKLFAYIKCDIENKKLVSVSLCLPDETGNIVAENTLFNRSAIVRFIA